MAESYDLLIYNLPEDKDVVSIKRRLKQLSNNCGGRVVQIRENVAVLRFCSKESADRYDQILNNPLKFECLACDSAATLRWRSRRINHQIPA